MVQAAVIQQADGEGAPIKYFIYEVGRELEGKTPQQMDPIVQKFTDAEITTTGNLKQQGDIDTLLNRLEIPSNLITKIKDELESLESFVTIKEFGDVYYGQVNGDGKRHGKGYFTYNDGSVFVGSFFEGRKHGQGFDYCIEDG